MTTQLNPCELPVLTAGSSFSKYSALIARHSVLYFALSSLLLAPCFLVEAQQPKKIYRIGFLKVSAPPAPYLEALRLGLRELGYIEGQNIVFEFRWAKRSDELSEMAAELASLEVDFIVTDGAAATLQVKKATGTIPTIMAEASDPVGTGLVASLARPGGNITGMTGMGSELGGKFLELFKEAVQKIDRVAIIRLMKSEVDDVFIKNTEEPARALGIKLEILKVQGASEYESAFRTAVAARAGAVLPRGTARFSEAQRKRVVESAIQTRLPALYGTPGWVEIGGLMSYGADRIPMWRRVAVFMEKIIKGTKPGDIPVERPTKFEFVINLKTAKQIGLTIPPNVLARADKVIR